MEASRTSTLLMGACLVALLGCDPISPLATQTDRPEAVPGDRPAARFVVEADPRTRTVQISPADFKTQATGLFARSANVVWAAPVFSFDALVTNHSGALLSNVWGVILSTSPPAPTITAIATSGTTPSGLPYYAYGNVPNGTTASVNWQFSDPSATPFRFGFSIYASGADAGPAKNHAPTVSALAASPASVTANGTTSLTATASDPNADTLAYSWSAPSGGSVAGTGNTATFTAPAGAGTYPVTVTVDDGKGATATRTVNVSVSAGGGTDGTAQGNVSFGNVPTAAVKRATLSPAAVTIDPGDPVSITATGYDNPGNAVATTWTWAQTGTTAMIWRGTFDHATSGSIGSWRTFYGRTDAGTATITARSANNQTASMTVTVRELAPVISTFSPGTPNSIPRNTARTYSVTFQDANGNNTTNPVVTLAPNFNHLGYSMSWNSPDNDGKRTVNVNMNGFTVAGETKTLTVSQADTAGNTVAHSWTINVTP